MIEINNLTSFAVDKKFFTGVAKKVLKEENKEKKNLSVAFISGEEIKKLNKKYRKKNKATDVLSFGQVLGFKFESSKNALGEIVICPKIVKENIKKYNIPPVGGFKKELAKVLIHGILHLLEYDHEKTKKEEIEMEKKEEYYLCKFF
ncbi:MAG: rRNA maturation RNase YbeY [bacterium]|nr:rRNA maturation RNase YbeY [bacterium]